MYQHNELEKPDVESVMARIRKSVKENLKDSEASISTQRASQALAERERQIPLLYSEELNYLNANWQNWASAVEITSHRPLVGPIIVRLKRFLVNIAWNYLLKGYFERERHFQMHLVRHLNATARYIEARDAQIFWELVNKIDTDIRSLNERFDRIFEAGQGDLETLRGQLSARLVQLEGDRDALADIAERGHRDILQLDQLMRSLEATISMVGQKVSERVTENVSGNGTPARKSGGPSSTEKLTAVDHALLSLRLRESETEVQARYQDYLTFFTPENDPVVVLRCGRGEFLELLGKQQIEAFGIDTDPVVISRCREKGLAVVAADPQDYVAQLRDSSIGGIFAGDFIEELSPEETVKFIELTARKVKRGGSVVIEAMNPESLATLVAFSRKLTGERPVHPETLRFLMESRGLQVKPIMFRSPYPHDAALEPVAISAAIPPRWAEMLRSVNANVTRLNDFLFGYQRYCLVGIVP